MPEGDPIRIIPHRGVDLAARVLTPLSWIVGRTQWFLKEGKEHPLKAIGYVAGVVVFLGTVAARAVIGA
jgi:hypothetical protein